MRSFLTGFADELVKEAIVGGIAKSLFTKAKKGGGRTFSPQKAMATAMIAPVLVGTGVAASRARKAGLHGAEQGRYLKATRHRPSDAALINYHQLFKHKRSKKKVERISKHHRPSTFSSYRSGRKSSKKD